MASKPEMDLSSFQQEVTSSTGSFSTSYDDFYDQVRTNYHFGCNYFCNITLVRSSYHWALTKKCSLWVQLVVWSPFKKQSGWEWKPIRREVDLEENGNTNICTSSHPIHRLPFKHWSWPTFGQDNTWMETAWNLLMLLGWVRTWRLP